VALVCDGRLFHARTAPQETHGRRELINGLTAPASSGSRQNTGGDELQRLMSAADCQPDTPVLYHVHSGMPEHTTGTAFALERVTIAAPEAEDLLVIPIRMLCMTVFSVC